MMRTAFLWAALILPTTGAAQFDNPEQKIQELTEQIATDLQEIDKLLLQTGAKGGADAAESMARSVEKIDELLDQAKLVLWKGIRNDLSNAKSLGDSARSACVVAGEHDDPQPSRRELFKGAGCSVLDGVSNGNGTGELSVDCEVHHRRSGVADAVDLSGNCLK